MLEASEMLTLFRPDPARPYRALVGFEYEVPLFDRQTLTPLRYDGARGLGSVLAHAAQWLGGTLEPGHPPQKVSLPGGATVSLEPGGQLEFSSEPQPTFAGCLEQLARFEGLLASLAERFAVQPFFGGVSPVHTVDEIGLVLPSERYRLMDRHFAELGTMGRRMMRQSASLQITFDYSDAAVGRELLRAALFVAPWVAGMLAHSPFVDGALAGFRSFRQPIWRNTDPARCGLLPGFQRPDYGFSDYLAHLIEVPLLFVATPQGLRAPPNMTFAELNERGLAGRAATLDDLELHNSTIFTDVRLKRTIELRSVDAQEPRLARAVIALLSGLLLGEGARRRTLALLGAFDEVASEAASAALARDGLQAEIAGRSARAVALALLGSARQELGAGFAHGDQAAQALAPLAALVARGQTPADIVLERCGGRAERWLALGPLLVTPEICDG
jgi:glutamate--cysteine ligase